MAATKVKAPPKARLYFYKNKSNGVSVKFTFLDKPFSGFRYTIGTKRLIKYNRDEDRNKYQLIIGFSVLDNFLSANNIKDGEVEIDPASIEVFYGYDNTYAVSPTNSFVNKWWNYDCPDLFRYAVNKTGKSNWTGLDFVYFSNKLVEASYMGTYIDDDITEEEVKIFSRDREHTQIYTEMMNVLNAQNVSEEEIAEMESWIKSYEKNIQKAIDGDKLAIMMHIGDMFDAAGKEKSFGLDCGFLNIFTENEEYKKKKGLLKNLKTCASWLDVRMPYETQSLTVKTLEFQKVQEVVLKQTGEKLYCKAALD